MNKAWLRVSRFVLLSLALALLPTGLLVRESRADITPALLWTGLAGNHLWSADENWAIYTSQGLGQHRHPENGDALLFHGSSSPLNNDLVNLSLAGIAVDAVPFNLTGHAVTITTSIIAAAGMTSGEIQMPVILGKDVEIQIAAQGALTFTGGVSGGSILKTGAGTLRLAGINTFSGGVVVSAGQLSLGHSNAAGTGPIQVESGAVLQPALAIMSLPNPLILSGNGSSLVGALHSECTTLNLNGAITLAADTTLFASGNTYYNGAISGSAALTLTGGGTHHLAGAAPNTFTGKLKLAQGSLRLEKSPGVVAVPAALDVGDSSLTPTVSLETLQDGQFSPASQVMLYANATLRMNGTSQTLGGVDSRAPCTLAMDSATGKPGSLAVQTVSGPQNYIYCDVVGSSNSSITVSGDGLQSFDHNPNPFAGSLEVKGSAASYLYGFHINGPYIVRSDAAGGLQENSDAESVLVEASSYFMFQSGPAYPPQTRAGSLVLTGSGSPIFSINTASGPVLEVDNLVSLGGSGLFACANAAYMPNPGETRVLIRNDSALPFQGTFLNLPEGAKGSLYDCWSSSTHYPMRIHYAAGDGNDLTLTRLIRSTLSVYVLPDPPMLGQPVTLQARMALTDTLASPPGKQKQVAFYDGSLFLGAATFGGEYATFQWANAPAGLHLIQARYAGDDFYEEGVSSVKIVQVGKLVYIPLIRK
jgi:autotransporter-associated beta strand protein